MTAQGKPCATSRIQPIAESSPMANNLASSTILAPGIRYLAIPAVVLLTAWYATDPDLSETVDRGARRKIRLGHRRFTWIPRELALQ